jgi:NAD(P)-dependent dehydrogenase (short-subunit alcohol dehydrogenase family)
MTAPGTDVQFKGKVALVTGASGGIGRAAALRFAAGGATVVCSDIAEDGGHETVSMIAAMGGTASLVLADVSSESDVESLIDITMHEYGRLDIAFNNAGIGLFGKPLIEITEDDYDRVMGINSTGVFLCIKYEIPAMLQSGGGCIVNTASKAGLVGDSGLSVYSGSKHAVVGMTKTAALEYARKGIRVNCVAPGVIDTDINTPFWQANPGTYEEFSKKPPMGRMGTAEEVAEAVAWLCTDDAAFVHGHAMSVDAGLMAE